MSFFPLYSSNRGLTPLFRLLDDFDSYSHERKGNGPQRAFQPTRTFTPKFDVRETDTSYELHGELAGLDRSNIQIEFTEPQTLVVRGKVERNYTSNAPKVDPVDATSDTKSESKQDDKARPRSPHQATVEDESDDVESEGTVLTPVETPEPTWVRPNPTQEPSRGLTVAGRYWVSERSIGEFSRTFNFPSRVEPEAVTASFDNGLLSVLVPKAKKHEIRRITIR